MVTLAISRGAEGTVRWLEVDAKQESKPKNIFKATLLAALQGTKATPSGSGHDCRIIRCCHTHWRARHSHRPKGKAHRQFLEGDLPSYSLKASGSASLPVCVHTKSLQLCPTQRHYGCTRLLWTYGLTRTHGILQARILEWVAMTSSKGSS